MRDADGVPCANFQGELGDCWLLSAISVLAEKKGQIQQIFLDHTQSHWGKYRLKLWQGLEKKFVVITVDDMVPCKDGRPIFTKPKGNEMWVLLLEKAFAKLLGGYSKLEGGMPLFALEAMTVRAGWRGLAGVRIQGAGPSRLKAALFLLLLRWPSPPLVPNSLLRVPI